MSFSRIGFTGVAVLGLVALAPVASAAPSFTEIPTFEGIAWQGRVFDGISTDARAITPDGRYVVGYETGIDGTNPGSSIGFIWDSTTNTTGFVLSSDGAGASIATGVGYRTSGGQTELIVAGMSAGYVTEWMSNDGGVTFGVKRRDTSWTSNLQPGYNALGSSTASDTYYVSSWISGNGQSIYLGQGSGLWVATVSWLGKGITSTDSARVNGVSASSRCVGSRVNSSIRKNYMLDWTGTTPAATYFNGLDGTQAGEAFSVSADGNTIFGRSPKPGSGTTVYPYKVVNPGGSQTINELPIGAAAGSVSLAAPYGASADGRFCAGMLYLGHERAALWDTGDPNPANWKVYDLTAYLEASGVLGPFFRLTRAYTVAATATDVYVAGIGALAAGGSTGWYLKIPLADLPLPDAGACCIIGSCSSKLQADCPDIPGQQRWTANTTCLNAACPGACCTDSMTGACSDFVESATCTDGGGTFRGASSSCAAGVCLGSCCKTDGNCEAVAPGACTADGGIAGALGSVCEASTCLGACCVKAGQCEEQNYGECPPVKFKGIGTVCEANTCPCSIPFADADGDGDVDQADFAFLQACYTGLLGEPPALSDACACMDRDVNSQITGDDVAAFEACATGAGVPWTAGGSCVP